VTIEPQKAARCCHDRGSKWTTVALAAIFFAIAINGFVRRPRWVARLAAAIAIALAVVAAVALLVG
jgi:hypothetical protein